MCKVETYPESKGGEGDRSISNGLKNAIMKKRNADSGDFLAVEVEISPTNYFVLIDSIFFGSVFIGVCQL